jgi:hypothetical protein
VNRLTRDAAGLYADFIDPHVQRIAGENVLRVMAANEANARVGTE